FCGWVCPQTIFLEFLYRPIEWLIEGTPAKQRRLNKGAWTSNKAFKKISKHIIYFVLAFIIINVFLSYFIGYEAVFQFLAHPFQQVGLLIGVLAFSFMFYGVFAHVREIVCTTICPYGRLQGTLFDEDTMQIAYDYNRGEPRAKFKKNKERTEGDCIDCHQCVDVCPTGIDIRNGLQMECVGCTACIDACDFMMKHVNLPTGLIRYASEREIKTGTKIKFTTKAKAYTGLLVILVAVLAALIITRKDINVQIVRASGQSYTKLDNGERYSNMYNLKAINKIAETVKVDVKLVGIDGKIDVVGNEHIALKPESITNNPIIITIDDKYIKSYKTKIELDIYNNGKIIQRINTNFIGPFK
ncbi:MAG: cytochrome c oxidase accessory protein CcoG, partial [Chitinophagales bacterium]